MGYKVPALSALMTAFLFTGTPTLVRQSAVLRVKPFGRIIDFMEIKYKTKIEKAAKKCKCNVRLLTVSKFR